MKESDTNKAPKYSVCFMDLAEFLNIKDDIAAKIKALRDEKNLSDEASYISPPKP